MNKRTSYLIGGVVIVFGLVAIGYYIYKDVRPSSVGNTAQNVSSDDNSASTTIVDIGGVAIEGGGAGTIVPVPIPTQKDIPNLDRTITVPASFPLEAKKNITDKILTVSAALKKDPTDFGNWLDLAIFRKMVDDYEGARLIWEFLKKTNPEDSTAYINLADLYGYYLKNNLLAEQNYLEAIDLAPSFIGYYLKTFDFYKDVLKNKQKMASILDKALAVEPNNADLLKLKESLSSGS